MQQGSPKVFYGWWIVGAAFLNLFFVVGIIFYSFPLFYPSIVAALGCTVGEVTRGFTVGVLVAGVPAGLAAGALIDRIGARPVVIAGVFLAAVPLILMGRMQTFWQYEVLCAVQIGGYMLAGPIPNQVVVSHWFRARRGRAMGMAYVGLGLGSAAAQQVVPRLLAAYGWRHAIEAVGACALIVLLPVNLFILRSLPQEMGLAPDGETYTPGAEAHAESSSALDVAGAAFRNRNFWLIVAGCSLLIGAMNSVIQNLILYLGARGYVPSVAAHYALTLTVASLGGRVIVGYLAERTSRRMLLGLFYLVLGLAIPLLLFADNRLALAAFACIFGFAMGADYMLIPLVVSEVFGMKAFGRILALIIVLYTVGQWLGPWVAGQIRDTYGSFNPAWPVMGVVAVLGAACIFAIRTPKATDPKI